MKTLVNIFQFYKEGFQSMTIGKKLWLIIGIKLIVMFAILKLFFFRNFLSEHFNTSEQKSEYVIDQLTKVK
ncbi:MAG: DUF4492 domain-containing protein [Bacteroidales bacterium]|nr:DUF4492 domain-containing protein [Bacteroidales bacterium]